MTGPRFRVVHAHKQVAETARDMCRATYQGLMGSSNEIYSEWKRTHPGMNAQQLEDAFVRKYWSKHIAPARATLATMLSGPYDDAFKASIHEALVLDQTLVKGRKTPQLVMN